MKMIKQFALENGELMSNIGFFLLVSLSFLLVLVHAIKMKKSTTEELANLVIKNDTE